MTENKYKIIKVILRITFVVSIIALVVSSLNRHNLPEKTDILKSLDREPVQQGIDKDPFKFQKEDYTYNITPHYSYEMYGLVVSDYDSEVWYDILHEHDPLNTKDICVIWGDNINTDVYQQMKYSHGEFTCYAEFKSDADRSWYDKFNPAQVANNHMLPADDAIYKSIKSATIGDQIYIKGVLVDYSINTPQGPTGERTTSTVRDDYGCEIIYTTGFEVIKKGNELFHTLHTASLFSLVASLISLIVILFIE